MSGAQNKYLKARRGGKPSRIRNVIDGLHISELHLGPARRSPKGSVTYLHLASGDVWTLVRESPAKSLLRAPSGESHWVSRGTLRRAFVMATRPEHIECGCLSCRCPRAVKVVSDVCRKCAANLHDGRPNKNEVAR